MTEKSVVPRTDLGKILSGPEGDFMREGVRRKAYWRNDEWVDGVLYGLVAEDLVK